MGQLTNKIYYSHIILSLDNIYVTQKNLIYSLLIIYFF
jgi:hypothetical protein